MAGSPILKSSQASIVQRGDSLKILLIPGFLSGLVNPQHYLKIWGPVSFKKKDGSFNNFCHLKWSYTA